MNCVICKAEIKTDIYGWSKGHNAEPVSKGRCCSHCNEAFVIPLRLRIMLRR